jgi:hypothetical protein
VGSDYGASQRLARGAQRLARGAPDVDELSLCGWVAVGSDYGAAQRLARGAQRLARGAPDKCGMYLVRCSTDLTEPLLVAVSYH